MKWKDGHGSLYYLAEPLELAARLYANGFPLICPVNLDSFTPQVNPTSTAAFPREWCETHVPRPYLAI